MNSRWKKYLLYAGFVIIGGGLLFILIETIGAKNTGFETKTLWDWMNLLIVPLVLAIGAFFLNRSELAVERQRAEEHGRLEREIATDRQQEATLQSYLNQMADLLLEKKLRTSKNKELRNIAKIWTLTTLRELDGKRKGIVLVFLMEAGLVAQKPIINLNGANFRNAYLPFANLSGASLHHVNLCGANLSYANLSGIDLSEAHLSDAHESDSDQQPVALVNLSMTDLSNANLKGADLVRANLYGANLSSSDEGNGILFPTDLSGANLSNAVLTSTNLSNAIVSNEQLATTYSLKDAIMPDGTKHD